LKVPDKSQKEKAIRKSSGVAPVQTRSAGSNDDKSVAKLRFKKRMTAMFVGAIVCAVLFLVELWFAFNDDFKVWQIAVLFATVIADIVFWILSYVFKEKYGASLRKNAGKTYGSGNRSNRRKDLK
jgi:amino acid permease